MPKDYRKLVEKTLQKETIIESSLSRVWSFVQDRKPFAMISLSRGTMTDDEKEKAFIVLKQEVRKLKYGYIELKGGYVEKGISGEPDVDVTEYSLFIPNISKNHAIQLGQINLGHGPQDSVLYCDGNSLLAYIITNPALGQIGDIDTEFEYGKDKDALPMTKKAVIQYFSMLSKGSHRGKKFSFIPKKSSGTITEEFKLYEMRDRRIPKNPDKDWWYNFGVRIL